MRRHILNRFPLRVKQIVFSALIIGCFFLSFFLFANRLTEILAITYHIDLPIISVLKKDFLRFFLLGAGLAGVFLYLIFWDVHLFLRRINNKLVQAVAKKKLSITFNVFETHDLYESITKNANALFAIFKSYDNMKSSRVSLEVNTIKLLMNTVKEGVILVNRNKVVTHINHQAEDILRLVPGEIEGEAISRNVSHETFLDSLDSSLSQDKKITNLPLVLADDVKINLTILPIKNKFGDLVRALIVLVRG